VAANVMSFFNMTKRFQSVTYNNRDTDAFKVMRDDGSVREGLYYYDYNVSIECGKKNVQRTMVVDTVEQLKRNYNKRELEAAECARRLYITMGRPSESSFEQMIKKGKILNNPVTVMDYRNAIKIYGKDLGAVKGKTVRQKPIPVKIELDEASKERYNIILLADLMHLMGMVFLVTVSRNYTFLTMTYLR
jgi:hypothetical protein